MDNAELSDKPDESRGGGGGRDEGIDCDGLASQSGHTVLLHTSCCGKLTEMIIRNYFGFYELYIEVKCNNLTQKT